MYQRVFNPFLLSLAAGLLSITAAAQKERNKFVIEGEFVRMETQPARVYLVYDTTDYHPTDSAEVRDGKYRFEGSSAGVNRLTISKVNFDRHGRAVSLQLADLAEVFIDKGTLHIVSTGELGNNVVTGSQPELDYREASKHRRSLLDSLKQVVKLARETNNDVLLQSVVRQAPKFELLAKEEYTAFIRQHPGSPIDLYLIRQLVSVTPQAGWMDSVAALYALLPAATRSGPEGVKVGGVLDNELRTALGHQAPDFTQADGEGHPIRLSSFHGKYVLLDFWASWDNNASRALPILVKAYEVYGSKGLVVMGVSLDEDKDSWQQMIRETNSGSVTQVSDLKGRSNAAAQLYGITVLPRSLLIDPNGIIVARNLTSQSLDKTLSGIFE